MKCGACNGHVAIDEDGDYVCQMCGRWKTNPVIKRRTDDLPPHIAERVRTIKDWS